MNFTTIIPYYNNGEMLERQIETWKDYPKDWNFIVVDDGSRKQPAKDVLKDSGLNNLRLFRVIEDIPWNSHVAKNIGALNAKFGWMFMTDVDTILRPNDAYSVQSIVDHDRFYSFARIDKKSGESKNPHPNTFLVHKYQFWSIGGYDSDYSNESYGGDNQFRLQLLTKYKQTLLGNISVEYYSEDEFPGASVTDWEKKNGKFHSEYRERLKIKNKMNWNISNCPISCAWEPVEL